MKKLLVLLLLPMALLLMPNTRVKAYNNLQNDISIYNMNGSIVYADQVATNLYYYDVQFTKRNSTSKYVIFSTIIRDDVYISKKSTELIFELMQDKDSLIRLDKNTYIYHDGSAPQWNTSSTTVSGITFYVVAADGATGQLIVQDLLDNYIYVYVDLINTTQSTVVDEFLNRYSEEAFLSGYLTGKQEGKDVGIQIGIDSIDQDAIYQDGYDYGYDVGYDTGINANVSNNFLSFKFLMGMFFETFAILNIEILPNLKLGWLVGVPLFLGMLSFIVGVATFSISQGSRGVKKK